MEKYKNISWLEAFHINVRALKILYNRCPKLMGLTLFYKCLEGISPYVTIVLSARIIEELVTNKEKERLMELIILTLVITGIIGVIQHITYKFYKVYRSELYANIKAIYNDKLLSMDYRDIDNTETHNLLNEIEQSQNSGGWGFVNLFVNIEGLVLAMTSLFTGILVSAQLFTTKVVESDLLFLNTWWLNLGVIVLILVFVVIGPLLSTKSNNYFVSNIGIHNESNQLYSFYCMRGLQKETSLDARIYSQERFIEKYLGDKKATFCSKGPFSKLAKGPMGLYAAAGTSLNSVIVGIVYLFVGLKSYGGAFHVGYVTQYIGAITKLAGSFSTIFHNFGYCKANASFLKMTFEFLDKPNEMYQGSLTVEKRSDKKYEIEFRNVSFKYPGSESYSLKNVSMKFNIGERIAVVGQNGSGKTTFIKLLCRLYDPTEGVILLNGIDIRKYDYLEYISIFSIVFQDFKLLSYTLGENISVSSIYDKEKAASCLERAGFHNYKKKFSEGMDTYLYKEVKSHGIEVSGGEAQKIALARALYKDSSFMILDEPTAALDPIAEAEVYSSFNDIIEGKTAVYISHRLSSCKFCDEIVVFNEGNMVEKGTHDELVYKNGKYSELWNAQAKYYTVA